MKLFDKKSIIKILDEDLKDAQLSSMDFADDATKKRAFINVLGARLAIKFLFTKKVEANNLYSLYSIHKILSELDIADIYFEGIKIDVRLVFNKEEIFIPKSHFQYDILPNAYLVLTLEEDLSSVEFLGYFEPKDIDKKNENKDFYFFEKDKLQKPDSFKKFLESYVMTDDFSMSEKETEAAEGKFVEYLDNQLSTRNKQTLIKQLASNIELRERFVEFENFELLSREAVKKDDLFQDNVLEIIGAQKAFEEEIPQTKTQYKAEVIGEVLEGILTEEELEEEPKEQVLAKATSIDDYFNDTDSEIKELTEVEIETEIEIEKAAETTSKSEGKLLENSVKALTAGLELGAVLAATGSATSAATGAAAAANAQLQGEIIKGGAEILAEAIDSGINIAKTENLADEKTEEKAIDFSVLDEDDDMTLEELNELLSDSKEDTQSPIVEEAEELELIEEIKEEDDELELVETIDSEIGDFVAPEEIIEEATETVIEETPEPKAEIKPETNKEPIFEINDDALPEIDFNEGILSEEPKATSKAEEPALKANTLVEEKTETETETEFEIEVEVEEAIKNPKQKKEPEFIFEADFEAEGISKEPDTIESAPTIEEETEATPTDEIPTINEQSEFEKLKAQMQTNEDEEATSDILDSLPLDKLGIDREALNKNQKKSAEEEGSIEDLFSFDEILPGANKEVSNETPESIIEKEDSLEAKIRALEESEDEEFAQELVNESSKINEADDDFLAQVDDFLKDIDLSDEQKSLLETSLDLDEDIFLDTKPVDSKNVAQTSTSIAASLETLTNEATAAAIEQTEEFDEIDSLTEQNDPLKILFEKEKLAETENDGEQAEAKTPIIPLEFYQNKKMVLAASVAGLVILSTIIGVSSMKNAQNVGMPQDLTANAPISADIQQPSTQQSDMPLPVTEQQTMMPDMSQTPQQAIGQNSEQMNTDMGKAVSDAFLSEPVNATISKVAWEVPEDLAYNDSFRKYLQIAGKNLKLNLQNDLLLTNEMAYSSKIIVDLVIDRNGGLQSSKITVSSGSAQIDKIVLQSVKETLKYLKFPSSELSGPTANATLIINF